MGDSGAEAGAKGVFEEAKGRAKEAAGSVAGNERLEREGEAQQDKAGALRDVGRKEAEAAKARKEAEAHETRERSQQ